MNEKLLGLLYIIAALLILVIFYAVPNFFIYLIWLIALGLLIAGIYLLFLKK